MSYPMRSLHLREDDIDDKPNIPPLAGPEIDDLDPTDSGIDDGLLPPGRPDGRRGRRPPSHTPLFPGSGVDYPAEPGLGPTVPRKGVDINVYQHKKTLAQGMMDLALLSANANQLRYVLESKGYHPYYYPSLVMISMSLILQIVVGIGLIINGRYNIKQDGDVWKADRINNFTVIGIFLVTIINVFISAFGVADSTSSVEPLNIIENFDAENATVENVTSS
ncbi:ninjurin-2-like [Zootermopsis nevadensis]|nr:ninjurin-2-like [Zootermopsis nevadensis]XP_021937498.1 ninjurin-2-like [Zootermopsis nevadensis]XP_021937499.1 ninjurin-2-like [Zootermopsis nevadensis]XP_021937500.1 ninjurin-2-like [Zootermopsis nevadensis]XP_021937501.1 ninjurin-2-like [Zootermopsis nevadensis]XP_021937502.1 ninjurin-2-like [Zootermopsis nevadensis]XP_021937504.1 ninjurin-2-like [Zootermopsis nevadensis]XP_021937505.1 ninjurin-2-like [Zootermopsis nevadensis]KDR09689.1 Ninjurin-2 [Zootermopsis nevadensis]